MRAHTHTIGMAAVAACAASLMSGLGGVRAANDWSVPCVQGECSYDVSSPDGNNAATLKIWGASGAISDITPAAGWQILSCDPNGMDQDIRLVCMHDDASCDHLLEGGAENTIVRLPESCAQMPFARVARQWTSQDQSLPAAVRRNIVSRASAPVVHALALDTNFTDIDPSKKGNVSFAAQGSTVGGVGGNSTAQRRDLRHLSVFSRKHRRGFLSSIADAFKGALDSIKQLDEFNKTLDKQLPPIDFNKSANLFNASVSCPASATNPAAFDASVSVDVAGNVHAVVDLGVAAAGTIIPPKVSHFALIAGLNANVGGTLDVSANANGHLDTGAIKLFEVGIPGFDIPGIFTIGPSFKLNAQATGDLNIDLDMKVDIAYTVNNAQLTFPPDQGASKGVFKPADSNLALSASSNFNGDATLEAHIIPTVDVGINFLGSVASATVFLDLDASATLDITGAAQASAGASTKSGKAASASAQGCVDLSSGLDVNAGAQGSFFGLFDKSTQVTLFSKDFELFQKCFNASTGNGTSAGKAQTSTGSSASSKSTASASAGAKALSMSHSASASSAKSTAMMHHSASSSGKSSASSMVHHSASASVTSMPHSAASNAAASSHASSSLMGHSKSSFQSTASAVASSAAPKATSMKRGRVGARALRKRVAFTCPIGEPPASSLVKATVKAADQKPKTKA